MRMNRRSNTIIFDSRRTSKKQKRTRRLLILAFGISILVGIGIAVMPNAYEITVNGEIIGRVAEREDIENALKTVESQLENQYNTEVSLQEIDEIKRVYTFQKDLLDPNNLPMYLREQLSAQLKFQKLIVDGKELGIISSEEALDEVLTGLKVKYYRDETVDATFVNDVKLETIYTTEDELTPMDELLDLCTKRNKEIIQYTVVSGDTLWGIATKLDVTLLDIISENEGMTEATPLKIGQVINVEISVPVLGLELIPEIVEEVDETEEVDANEEEGLTQS